MLDYIKKNLIPLVFAASVVGIVCDLYTTYILALVPVILILQILLYKFCDMICEVDTLQIKAVYMIVMAGIILLTAGCMFMADVSPGEYFAWIVKSYDMQSNWIFASFFLLLNFFIGSLIYYCSNVVYNILLNFLLVVMPVLLYIKAGVIFPRTYTVTLCLMFFLVAFHCSQGKLEDQSNYVSQKEYKWTLILLIAAILVPVFFLPGGRRTPFAHVMRNMGMSSSVSPDMGESSPESGNAHGSEDKNPEEILYYIKADAPLYLKRESYLHYNPDAGRWINDTKETYGLSVFHDKRSAEIGEKVIWYDDLQEGLLENPDIAAKYDISEADLEVLMGVKQEQKVIEVETVSTDMGLIPYPAGTYGTIKNLNLDKISLSANQLGAFDLRPKETKKLAIEYASYDQDQREKADEVLKSTDMKGLYEDLEMDSAQYDSQAEFNPAEKQINLPPSIKYLAEGLTMNSSNNLEKLEALEAFFHKGDFTYDDKYRPQVPGAEYFLFTSKKGACADYATSMALMAQSLNIPVRYTEGYQAVEYDKEAGRYIIRRKHAHAYVEGFIPGTGWKVFEPTVSKEDLKAVPAPKEKQQRFSWIKDFQFTELLQSAAVITLLVCLFHLLKRHVREGWFRGRVSRREASEAIPMMYRRLWRLLIVKHRSPVVLNSCEFERIINELYQHSPRILSAEFDRIEYGMETPDKNVRDDAYSEYKEIYRKIMS